MIETIIEKRSGGNEILENTTRTKLVLKGYHPERWTLQSEDDPAKIAELRRIARDMGVQLQATTRVVIASTMASSIEQAVDDISKQCSGISPTMVLFFASSRYDPASISRAMYDAFGGAQVIGCSTAGEIVSGRVLKDSIVAMAFDDRTVRDAAFSVVTSSDSLADAVRRLGEDIGTPLGELDFRKYVGLILIDGLSGSEERVMDRLGDLTNVTFIGGSAGTGVRGERTG